MSELLQTSQSAQSPPWAGITPQEACRAALNRIRSHPGTYNQKIWLQPEHPRCDSYIKAPIIDSLKHTLPEDYLSAATWAHCGTAGCVAAHLAAVAAEHGHPTASEIPVGSVARSMLGNPDRLWKVFGPDVTIKQAMGFLSEVASGDDPISADDRIQPPL